MRYVKKHVHGENKNRCLKLNYNRRITLTSFLCHRERYNYRYSCLRKMPTEKNKLVIAIKFTNILRTTVHVQQKILNTR